MRLGLKYPQESVVLSWDFTAELAGRKAVEVLTDVSLDQGSKIADDGYEALLAQGPWIEYGVPVGEDGCLDRSLCRDVVFQRVVGGKHGADYRVGVLVKTSDGLVLRKLSVLPVRAA